MFKRAPHDNDRLLALIAVAATISLLSLVLIDERLLGWRRRLAYIHISRRQQALSVRYRLNSVFHSRSHGSRKTQIILHNSNSNSNQGIYIAPVLRDPGRIQSQPRMFSVLCEMSLSIATASVCRQPVPCTWCGYRECSVADSSTCPRYDEVATRRGMQCRSCRNIGSTGVSNTMFTRGDRRGDRSPRRSPRVNSA